jgi:uncharacterized protein YjbI with pentapeptide repeats
MKPRRKLPALRKPDYFPAENVLTGYDAPRLLALGRDFEQYRFVNCDLSEANLGGLRLEDCLFELGVAFGACQDMLFGVHFDHCQLRYASFGGKRLAGTRFVQCSLAETDFTNADLSNAIFQDCDLARTNFHHTVLTGADFTTATNFSLDPETNTLTGARFALAGLPGLLYKYGIVVE